MSQGRLNCGESGTDCGQYQACLRPPLVDIDETRCVDCAIKRTDCGTDRELSDCNVYCQDEIRRMCESKIKSITANLLKNITRLETENENLKLEIQEYSSSQLNTLTITLLLALIAVIVFIIVLVIWLVYSRRYKHNTINLDRCSSTEQQNEGADPVNENTCLFETFEKEESPEYEKVTEDSVEPRKQNDPTVGSKPVGDRDAADEPGLERALEGDMETVQAENTADGVPGDVSDDYAIAVIESGRNEGINNMSDGENSEENGETNITNTNTDTYLNCNIPNAQNNESLNVGNCIINNNNSSNQNTYSNHNGVNNQNGVRHKQNGNIGQHSNARDYGQEKLTTVIPVQTQGTHKVTPSSAKVLPPTK